MTSVVGNDTAPKFTAIGFVLRIWEERLFLGLLVGLFTALAVIYSLVLLPKYTATMLIGHVTSVENPGGSSASGLGGAISLFGKNRDDPKYNLFLELIKTQDFAASLERKYHLIETAPKEERLRQIGDVEALLHSVATATDSETGITKLTVQLRNKAFAKNVLEMIYNEGNEAVRRIDTQRAKSFADYIESRFKNETNRSLQDALGSLLITQERFLMVTRVDLPYAAQRLDGPNVSNRPTSPRRFLIIAIGLVVSFALGLICIVLWDAIIDERAGRGLATPRLSDIAYDSLRRLPFVP